MLVFNKYNPANEIRVLGCFKGCLDILAAVFSLVSAYIVSEFAWLPTEELQHNLLIRLTISDIELI
jgi:hypothetical protein